MRSIFNFHPDSIGTIFNSKNGFTLIELIIVVALIGIVSAISTLGLVDYTRTARLNAAANELVTILNVAKSNALSQVKDSALCDNTDTLNGFKVVINTCTTYDLSMVCASGDKIIRTKSLPDNIGFANSIPVSFLFPVLKGGAIMSGSGTIIVSGFGKTRCIQIDSQGVISQPASCPAPVPCTPPPPTPTPTPTSVPTPTPTPTPPPAKTCTLATTVWRSGLDAACAAYCGASTPTVTCSVQDSVTSETHAKNYNYVTCTSSLSQNKSGSVCFPIGPALTTCTCN